MSNILKHLYVCQLLFLYLPKVAVFGAGVLPSAHVDTRRGAIMLVQVFPKQICASTYTNNEKRFNIEIHWIVS